MKMVAVGSEGENTKGLGAFLTWPNVGSSWPGCFDGAFTCSVICRVVRCSMFAVNIAASWLLQGA